MTANFRRARRMVPKPDFLHRLEGHLAAALPVHPNVLSAVKLVVITPLMFLALRQVDVLTHDKWWVGSLFVAFALLDYLDGVIARGRGLTSNFGRVFDRFTDYPLLFTVSYFCIDVLPLPLVLAKLALDAMLLALYIDGRGSTENRLRTGINYATVLALLFLSQGWWPVIFSTPVVEALLTASIFFSGTVALHNLDVFKKRYIADMLSGANLTCGVFSIFFASQGRFEISLLFLLLGAAFDGFDGAAARRWGGTRFGVYSDDIADGVNYGIAPGAALYFALGGWTGAVTGIAFATFTIGRLIYFTLNKNNSDPEYFAGAPSTLGGIVTMCSLILFGAHPELVGLFVGGACVLMVSFDSTYRHVGRVVGKHKRRALAGASAYVVLLVLGGALFGARAPAALILIANLAYGFLPVAKKFAQVTNVARPSDITATG